MTLVEACITSVDEALTAQEAGADRLELCRDLAVGGLTPAADTVLEVVDAVAIPVVGLVRPWAGTFPASTRELRQMVRDVAAAVTAGADGVVFGVLDASNRIDAGALRELVAAAGGSPITFHKAFDVTSDLFATLADLEQAGVTRVLTSGGARTAREGRGVLRELIAAETRLAVMAVLQAVHARASAIPGIVEALETAGLRDRAGARGAPTR